MDKLTEKQRLSDLSIEELEKMLPIVDDEDKKLMCITLSVCEIINIEKYIKAEIHHKKSNQIYVSAV